MKFNEENYLRRCISDLVALTALPSVWQCQSPKGVAESLAEILVNMLGADFVYVSLRGSVRPAFHPRRKWETALSLDAVAKAIDPSLDPEQGEMLVFDWQSQSGPFTIAVARIGFSPCQGWVAVGVERASFPSQEERLLLSVAANQTTTVLDRLSAQDARKLSEERYALAARATRDAIWDWDLVTNQVDWNEALYSEYGYPRAALHGDADWWIDRIHPDDRERVFRSIHEVIDSKTETHWAGEYRFIKSDGTAAHVLDRGFVVRNEAGNPVRMIGAMQDVTDRVLAQQQVERNTALLTTTVEDLRSERGLRERFVAALSHDLRTPMSAARMNAQLLSRRAADPETVRKACFRISTSMARADRMIQDLLDVTRIRAGEKMPLAMQECSLEGIVGSALEQLQAIHGERFLVARGSEESISGYWDPLAIERIIENLASNAVKYGSTERPVTIHYRSERESAVLSVHNAGNELSPEDQEQLFSPYHRADAALSSGKEGWGIGLTLVKEITEGHRGKVRVDSSRDRGTTFSVRLPLDARGHA